MPFIWSQDGCHNFIDEDKDELSSDLPGGCSNVKGSAAGDSVDLTFNFKHLCPGQIAGIVVGVVGFVTLVGVAGVALSGLLTSGGASTADYVAL